MFSVGDRIQSNTVTTEWYDVLSKPKNGAIGNVYKVQDAEGQTFAAKVLDVPLEEKWKRRWRKEFDILRKCNHPSIVKVFRNGTCSDIGDKREKAYIIMEFIDGKTLDDYKASAIDWNYRVATKMIRQTAKALEYANSLRIVHRDLKPNNIMIRNYDRSVVVVDFGMAKDFAEASAGRSFTAVGARAYRCKHKIHFPQDVTYSDEIWSLGVTFYNLLTGELPFWDDNEAKLRDKIEDGNYIDVRTHNPEVPEDIAQIVRKMINHGETADYKNCRYLLRDFDRLAIFEDEINKVTLSKDLSEERVSTYQQLVTKIYGPINQHRTAHEMCLRLASEMGRTNALLVELQAGEKNPALREEAIDHLARCFVWLCGLALKVGIDLESAVWRKFPSVCPYCLECHSPQSTCMKATKHPIDIWRLRDFANDNAGRMPKTLRSWEHMFSGIYPASAEEGYRYLSKKLVEEVGEVAAELTKPRKRAELLQQTGVDSLAFEISDLFAWTCQASRALREEDTPSETSILGEALASRMKYEICHFCCSPICICDPERETEQKKAMSYYLEYDEENVTD